MSGGKDLSDAIKASNAIAFAAGVKQEREKWPEWYQQTWNGVAECVRCGGYQGKPDPDDPLLGHRPGCVWA